MQQNAHRKAALGVYCDRATAAARLTVIFRNSSRHFSSPGELDPGVRIATPE
jgi:hypothetical protein